MSELRTIHVASTGLDRPYTLVFDGNCRMCTQLSHKLRDWDRDRTIEVVASQAPGVTDRFPWIPPQDYAQAIQLVGPGGQTWQGAAAVEQLLGVLPRGGWIAWLFHIPGVRILADAVYRWIARNRYRLGCGEHCQSHPLNGSFRD